MPTSARWAAANLPKISEKTVHPAGAMCTGKRQTHIRNAPSSRTAVTGIGPYNAYRRCIKNSELLQVPREKSRKTEGVFLVGSRGAGGKSKSPRLVFFSQSFLLEKQKKMLDSSRRFLIRVLTLLCVSKCCGFSFIPRR